MADTIGGVTLVKFVEVSTDGSSCSLYGWPRPSTSSINDSTCEPALRSAGWRPFKPVEACSPAIPQLANSRPVVDCPLEYYDKFGWHYRYLQIVRVPGQPPLTSPQLNKSPCTPFQPPVDSSSPDSSLILCPTIKSSSDLSP